MKSEVSAEDGADSVSDDLKESLELLIERNNPMANAAENAVELL